MHNMQNRERHCPTSALVVRVFKLPKSVEKIRVRDMASNPWQLTEAKYLNVGWQGSNLQSGISPNADQGRKRIYVERRPTWISNHSPVTACSNAHAHSY